MQGQCSPQLSFLIKRYLCTKKETFDKKRPLGMKRLTCKTSIFFTSRYFQGKKETLGQKQTYVEKQTFMQKYNLGIQKTVKQKYIFRRKDTSRQNIRILVAKKKRLSSKLKPMEDKIITFDQLFVDELCNSLSSNCFIVCGHAAKAAFTHRPHQTALRCGRRSNIFNHRNPIIWSFIVTFQTIF